MQVLEKERWLKENGDAPRDIKDRKREDQEEDHLFVPTF